jgi:ApeA N-terminal domain 1
MTITANGEFWVPEEPTKTVKGAFKGEPGQKPEVRLVAGLVDDPQVRVIQGGVAFSSSPADSVRAFLPITVQGQLESGESVTLLNAQNYGGSGYSFTGPPNYKAHYAILGDRHVSGVDQLLTAIRFRFGDPYWLAHLQGGEAHAVDSDGSMLSVETSDDGNWLVQTAATPAVLRRLESRVVLGCVTLAELALDQDFASRDTQVRIKDGDAWLTVLGPGANTPPKEFDYDTLLLRDELTIERFAKWIPVNDVMDGIASVVARPIKALLQTEVLVVTALVEGLHRRLDEAFEQSKFPDASRSALDKIRQAARRTAQDKAADLLNPNLDPDQVHTAVMDAVSRFDDVDYLQRATDVVAKVCGVLPEIAESVAMDRLPVLLKDARNEMAHQLPLDEEQEPLDVRYLRWLVVTSVTPWLLRGLLLLEAGVDPSVLHSRHLANNRFLHFRANVAQFVSELGWQLPSPS